MEDYSKCHFFDYETCMFWSNHTGGVRLNYQETVEEGEVGDWENQSLFVSKGKVPLLLKTLVNIMVQRMGYTMNDIINIITKGDPSKWTRK